MKIRILILLSIFIFSCSFSNAKTQQEEYQNDALYSEEYFNYIIEQASIEREEAIQTEKQKKLEEEKALKKAQSKAGSELAEVDFEIKKDEEDIITNEYTPFKLRIIEDTIHPKYSESFKVEDSKTIIPIGSKLSIFQNLVKTRNKYSSNDYKILAGSEYRFNKYFNLEGGLETNYRGIDQNPQSRTVYLTPTIYISDKLSLSFINKYNPQSKSSDHDISLKLSPFKSKALDFSVYSSVTHYQSGAFSESVSFSTNFYFK